MKTSDFDYQLPQELIAQTAIEPRDASRLMVISRADGSIEHRRFYHLPEYLREGDVLVFNDSRVIPARLYGTRKDRGGKIELLLLNRVSPGVWRSLVRPGRRMREGAAFEILDTKGKEAMTGKVIEVESDGIRVVKLDGEENLERAGNIPLPPYIHEPLQDSERYQTVYSRAVKSASGVVEGSVAAPTAGLHFTPELLEKVRSLGVETVFVTLHVGWGTFRPIKDDDVSAHHMHEEYWELSQQAADTLNHAKQDGRRVISVGTTAVRLLEQAASQGQGELTAASGWADIFITPGYEFKIVDTLITNFHLPKSTLLMLVSALAERDLIFKAYQEAIEQRYRFYSFGDAMLIL